MAHRRWVLALRKRQLRRCDARRCTAGTHDWREGRPTSLTPRWSGLLGGDYQFQLTGAISASLGARWRYVGDRPADFQTNAAIPRYLLPSYNVLDLRAQLQRGAWSASLYAKNLNDSRGQVSNFPFGSLAQNAIIQPRTLGLSLAFKF